MVFIVIHMLGNHACWIRHWLQSLYNIYIVIDQYNRNWKNKQTNNNSGYIALDIIKFRYRKVNIYM